MKPEEIKCRFEVLKAALHQAAFPSELVVELTATLLFLKRATDLAAAPDVHSTVFAQRSALTNSLRGFSWAGLASSKDTARAAINLLETVESAVRQTRGLSSQSALAQNLIGRGGQRAEFVAVFNLIADISLIDSTDHEVSRGFQLILDAPTRNAAAGATPATVRDLCVGLIAVKPGARVYDPACGFASILCDAARFFEAQGLRCRLVGQELMPSIAVLARLNAFLGGWKADFYLGDTLREPQHSIGGELGTFDVVVAHPPFGVRVPLDVLSKDRFGRFGALSPATSESAFVQHVDRSIAADGCGVVLVPSGLLWRSGRDREVRAELVRNGRLAAVIGLPAYLFPGTAIPVSVLVLRGAELADASKPVVFVDLSQSIEGQKTASRLTKQGIKAAIESVRSGAVVDGFSAVIERHVVEDNGFDLAVGRYVPRKGTEGRLSYSRELLAFKAALEARNLAESTALQALHELEALGTREKKDPATH